MSNAIAWGLIAVVMVVAVHSGASRVAAEIRYNFESVACALDHASFCVHEGAK